jgi:hypothetical protein
LDLGEVEEMDSWVIWTLASLFLFAGIGYWFMYLRNFKHIILVHDMVRGKSIIRTDKAREFVDKDQIARWHLLKEKVKLERPPSEYIQTTPKGNKIAYLIKHGDLDYKWAELKPEDIAMGKSSNLITSISPGARIASYNQYMRALKDSQSPMQSLLQQALPMIAIAIICIFAFFMYTNISDGVNRAVASFDSIATKQADIAKEQTNTMVVLRDIQQGKTTYYPTINSTGAPN